MSKAVTHTRVCGRVGDRAAGGRRSRFGRFVRNGRRSASVIFAVPVSRDGADAGSIKFGVRLPGLIPS